MYFIRYVAAEQIVPFPSLPPHTATMLQLKLPSALQCTRSSAGTFLYFGLQFGFGSGGAAVVSCWTLGRWRFAFFSNPQLAWSREVGRGRLALGAAGEDARWTAGGTPALLTLAGGSLRVVGGLAGAEVGA